MHTAWLQQTIDLALENTRSGDGGPYGALIVKDNQVIAACGNQVTRNLDPTAHAEIMAIRLACQRQQDFQLHGCILYSSCEPCPMCLGAIYWARLEQVYFACTLNDAALAGFDDSFIYEQIAVAPEQRKIPMRQLTLESALTPFVLWQQKADRRLY